MQASTRRALHLASLAALVVLAGTVAHVGRSQAQLPIPDPNQVAAHLVRMAIKDVVVPAARDYARQVIPELYRNAMAFRQTLKGGNCAWYWPICNPTAVAETRRNEIYALAGSQLVPPGYRTIVDQMDRHRSEVARLNQQLVDAGKARIGAPRDAGWIDWVVGRQTAEGFDKQAQEHVRQLGLRKAEIAAEVAKLRAFLREQIGVDLQAADLDNLLSRADGQELLRSLVLVRLLAHVVDGLADLAEKERMHAELAMTYYETRMFLHGLVIDAIRKHLTKYEAVWLPRIDRIMAEVKDRLDKDARLLAEVTAAKDQGQIKRVQDNTRSVLALQASARELRDSLIAQRDSTRAQLASAEREQRVDDAVLERAKLEGRLAGMIRSAKAEYATIGKLQQPSVVRFKDNDHRQRQEGLSLQLAQMK